MSEREKPRETPEATGCLTGLLRLAALKLLGIIFLKTSFVLALLLLVGGSLLLGFEPPDWMGCFVIPVAVAIFFGLMFGAVAIKERIWPREKRNKE